MHPNPPLDPRLQPGASGTSLDLQRIWLKGAYVLSGIYLVFAYLLIGIPGLSGFAAPTCVAMIAWIAWGSFAGVVVLPRVLLFPAGFFAFVFAMTIFDADFPFIYIGKIFTIWGGAIAFAVLVANGVKVRHAFDAFMVIALLNLVAIWVGYDGQQRNVLEELNMEEVELPRYSGLAGQQNTLSSLALMPFFLLLLRDQLLPLGKFLVLIVGGLLITYYTGSRNALVLTSAFAIASALFMMQGTRQRLIVLAVSLPMLLGWMLIASSSTARTLVEKSPIGSVTVVKRLIDQSDGIETSAIARQEYMKLLFTHFPESPIIGHGAEYFEKISPHQTYSHNNYVELLVNYGIVGLLVFYLMYARVLWGSPGMPLFERLRIASVIVMMLLADTWDVSFVTRIPILVLCIALIVVTREIRPSALD